MEEQTDSYNCGVHICAIAASLQEPQAAARNIDPKRYRRTIRNAIQKHYNAMDPAVLDSWLILPRNKTSITHRTPENTHTVIRDTSSSHLYIDVPRLSSPARHAHGDTISSCGWSHGTPSHKPPGKKVTQNYQALATNNKNTRTSIVIDDNACTNTDVKPESGTVRSTTKDQIFPGATITNCMKCSGPAKNQDKGNNALLYLLLQRGVRLKRGRGMACRE